jgi:hypothetical protein
MRLPELISPPRLSGKVAAFAVFISALISASAWAQLAPGVTFGFSFTPIGQLIETATSRAGTFTLTGAPNGVTYTVTGPGLSPTVFNTTSAGTNLANASAFLAHVAQSTASGFNPASSSPTDPAAGNPASLTSRMVDSSFSTMTGIGGFAPQPGAAQAGLLRVPNALTAGGDFGYGNAGGQAVYEATLPLSYTIFRPDPRSSLTIDLPVTYLNIGGVGAPQASLGASYKFPVTDRWSLAAGGRVGITTAGLIEESNVAYLFSVASIYYIYFSDYKVTIGNSVGVVKGSPIGIYSNPFSVNTTNAPIVNGISIEGSLPFTVFDRPGSWEAYVVDTYLPGTKLSIQNYVETGVNIGTRGVIGQQLWNNFRVGIAYTGGRSFNMVSIRGSYRF